MRHMKKYASILLALVMALALAVPALADGDPTITIQNPVAGHTYQVYQIFTGALSKDGTTLSDVKWGQNGKVPDGAQVGDAVAQETLDTLAALNGTDAANLDTIESYLSTNSTPVGTLSTEKPSDSFVTGYYLIKDIGPDPVVEGDSISLNVVQLVGPTTVTLKTSSTSFEKKVKDINDTNGTASDWQDSADYDIGDDVPFQLKATLGERVSDYDTYMVEFNDTLSAGLTLKADTIEVTIDGTKLESFPEPTINGNTFTLHFNDVKGLGAKDNSVIIVTYKATLNENAVAGSAGNFNEASLKYSNNPNNGQDGTGETPKDKVVVFTFEGIVDKVHENPDFNKEMEESADNPKYLPLTGAGFTLYKKDKDNKWIPIGDEIKASETTKFTWKGLDDGDYRLEETTTPDGYNTIDPIEFTIEATHDETSDNPTLTELKATVTEGTAEFTSNTANGSVSTQVVNYAGTELPETGGMGTKIFYVVGSVMALGAVVLLVTKRRMSSK